MGVFFARLAIKRVNSNFLAALAVIALRNTNTVKSSYASKTPRASNPREKDSDVDLKQGNLSMHMNIYICICMYTYVHTYLHPFNKSEYDKQMIHGRVLIQNVFLLFFWGFPVWGPH